MPRLNPVTTPGPLLRPLLTAPSPAAPVSAPVARDAGSFARFQQCQFDGVNGENACGTTSLSMLLNFWLNRPGAYTHDRIDPVIRTLGTFTTPEQVVRYAESQGFRASARNDSSLDELRGLLDRGVPVEVVIDPTGTGTSVYLHYVDVVGYETDAQGRLSALKIADPGNAGGTAPVRMGVAEFTQQWGQLHWKGVDTGLNNVLITLLPNANVPVVGRDGVVRQSDTLALPAANSLGWRMALVDAGMTLKNDAVHFWNTIAAELA